jgi:hypothetical protein
MGQDITQIHDMKPHPHELNKYAVKLRLVGQFPKKDIGHLKNR